MAGKVLHLNRSDPRIWISDVLTGTGALQTISHGLNRTPQIVFVVDGVGLTSVEYTDPADTDNIYVTAADAATYRLVAIFAGGNEQ
jgi:hypothetical protein